MVSARIHAVSKHLGNGVSRFLFSTCSLYWHHSKFKDWGRREVSKVISFPFQEQQQDRSAVYRARNYNCLKNITWKLNKYRKKDGLIERYRFLPFLDLSLPVFKVLVAFFNSYFTQQNLLLIAQWRLLGRCVVMPSSVI